MHTHVKTNITLHLQTLNTSARIKNNWAVTLNYTVGVGDSSEMSRWCMRAMNTKYQKYSKQTPKQKVSIRIQNTLWINEVNCFHWFYDVPWNPASPMQKSIQTHLQPDCGNCWHHNCMLFNNPLTIISIRSHQSNKKKKQLLIADKHYPVCRSIPTQSCFLCSWNAHTTIYTHIYLC